MLDSMLASQILAMPEDEHSQDAVSVKLGCPDSTTSGVEALAEGVGVLINDSTTGGRGTVGQSSRASHRGG
jgi:hypothetical protein